MILGNNILYINIHIVMILNSNDILDEHYSNTTYIYMFAVVSVMALVWTLSGQYRLSSIDIVPT